MSLSRQLKATAGESRTGGERVNRRDTLKLAAATVAVVGAAGPPAHAAIDTGPSNFRTRSVTVDGFQQNVIDMGTGPTVLMLHGFPNSSSDWRFQIPELVKAGYRVIAPDLLGLGKSDKPLAPEHYTVAKDAERALAVLTSLNIQRARIVGHDRGGGASWYIAAHHPERVEQLVVLTVGHPNGGRTPTIEQMEKSWYMLLFQFPIAEELLKRDNWRLFRNWMRYHPDTDRWIADLSPEGALTAGLGWYRANRRPSLTSPPLLPDVRVPALGLWTMEDHYLLPDYMLESYRFMRAPWRTERIDGASHFIMLDQPDRVSALVLEFFREQAGENPR